MEIALEIISAIIEQDNDILLLEDGSYFKKEIIIEALDEINNSMGVAKQNTIDLNKLKILFDSEFCRCSKCGQYKRSGFGCYCENE